MKKSNHTRFLFMIVGSCFLFMSFLSACTDDDDDDAYFFENFDSYEANSTIAGQGGWETWDNSSDPDFDAPVSNARSHSSPNSLWVKDYSDVVHQFQTVNSGQWVAKAKIYIPSNQRGYFLFIILNQYVHHGGKNWSVQISMSASSGYVYSLGGTDHESESRLPLITDAWVELRVEIDLDNNHYTVYYNDQKLDELPWTTTGLKEIQAIDLCSYGSSDSYFDDIELANK
ncbi:hypothetical protein ACFL27_28495 [candidate division CSSED10-310 bacterium]|uniref:3-keto-disaccharide hydrolase domain-containing protein n=1 Tax=candidate division CSSED10-310 bacterium TaxID=2855610 RepID=A0ABV6Z6S0_UNCC1